MVSVAIDGPGCGCLYWRLQPADRLLHCTGICKSSVITDKTILNALRAALGIFIGIDFFDLYFENDCGRFQNTFSQKELLPG